MTTANGTKIPTRSGSTERRCRMTNRGNRRSICSTIDVIGTPETRRTSGRLIYGRKTNGHWVRNNRLVREYWFFPFIPFNKTGTVNRIPGPHFGRCAAIRTTIAAVIAFSIAKSGRFRHLSAIGRVDGNGYEKRFSFVITRAKSRKNSTGNNTGKCDEINKR